MSKKYSLTALIALALTIGAITFGGHPQNNKASNPQASVVPEFVPYMLLFDHHNYNLQKAAELEQQGKDGTRFRLMLKQRAGLSDDQALIFDRVTSDCEQELALQDAKASVVIADFRARFPAGKLPEGVTLPPPPPELTKMQEERNAIILRSRDRLQAAFREQDFTRFDSLVQSQVVSGR